MAADEKLSGALITTKLKDQILTAESDGHKIEQIFQASGLTIYIVDGQQSIGQWRVQGDQYCSVWPPSEHWVCYDVVAKANEITFISSRGERYPMVLKSKSAQQP
jgi:hypothetical protein